MRVFLLSFGGKIAAAFFVAICIALGFGPDRWAKVVLGLDPSLIGRTAFITLAVLVSCTTIAPYLKQRKGRPILGPVIVASAAILACVGGLIWFVESLGTTKETNSGNGPKRPQTSLPTSEKQQDSASTTAEPRSKAVAGDEVGQVRVIFDRTNGRAAVIDQTSNVKIATVERDPSAIAMVGTVVIKVAFYTNVGPVIVQVTEVGNTMSSSIPKFAVVENSERFISLRIDPTSFANLIVVDSHEFRISFFRKKEGLVQPQSSKNKIGSIEGDEGGIART